MLSHELEAVAHALGLKLQVVQTDGTAPVGRGIGPALEARDVLAVLRGEPEAPSDLQERALLLGGRLLEFGGAAPVGGPSRWRRACSRAVGGPSSRRSARRRAACANYPLRTIATACRRCGAKLAGAPQSPCAGIVLQVRNGDFVERGQPLFTLHAASPGELAYALEYALARPGTVHVTQGG